MFNSAHDFYINNLFASDGNGGKDPVAMNLLKTLANAACLGAGHQSAERHDAPKCHPDTRVAVVNDAMSWVNADVSKESIMWMSGPAGAGKSAIAQTVCEKCYTNRTLLAAFFFSQTANGAGRDDGNRLVPTIACQLAIAVPEAKSFIIDAFYKDPAVLSYSMTVQMEKLVLEPLSQFYAMIERTESYRFNPQSNEVNIPHLVVIDGLDECKDPQMQSNIIKMIAYVLSKSAIRLRFLIASRPELEIRNTFQISSVSNICAQIVLNRDYDADDDIRVFLQSEFAFLKREHTLSSFLMRDRYWPSPDDIGKLVCKSSGQFVYASTIMKYLKDPRRDPRDVLKSILEFNSKTEDKDSLYMQSPFAELDALYMQVLNTAVSNSQNGKDAFTIIFQVLLFQRSGGPVWMISISDMAPFISMKKTTLKLLLSDLHSIIFVGDDDIHFIHFYHASFQDFLKDPSRSRDFYIDEIKAHTVLANLCFTHLYRSQPHDNIGLSGAEEYSRHNYFWHVMESGYNHTALKELRDIDTPHLRTILSLTVNLSQDVEESPFKHFFNFDFHNVDFAIPKEEKLKDICDRMTEIIDEILLSSCPSVEDAKESVLTAIFDIVSARTNCFRVGNNNLASCWLAMFMEIPKRGKHLYLDSKKYLSLFIMLCDAPNFTPNVSVTGPYIGHDYRRRHIHVMQYLLNRIEPSADIDTDDLQEMSTKIFKHYGGRKEKNILKKNVRDKSDAEADKERDTESYGNRHTEGSDSNNGDSDENNYSVSYRSVFIKDTELDSFLQSVKAFVQKCVYLKNARLEKAAIGHLGNDFVKAGVVEEHSDTLDHDVALKVHRSNHILGSIRKLPRKIREMVRRH